MPVNPRSSARMNEFLNELSHHNITAIHRKRSVYLVNGKNVSIRTTTKPGPIYWYDISKSINNDVDYIIYQMNSKYHFVLFPTSFFEPRFGSLKDSNRPNAKIFYIDWRNRIITSKPDYEEDITGYCCSTERGSEYGDWKKVFRIRE